MFARFFFGLASSVKADRILKSLTGSGRRENVIFFDIVPAFFFARTGAGKGDTVEKHLLPWQNEIYWPGIGDTVEERPLPWQNKANCAK